MNFYKRNHRPDQDIGHFQLSSSLDFYSISGLEKRVVFVYSGLFKNLRGHYIFFLLLIQRMFPKHLVVQVSVLGVQKRVSVGLSWLTTRQGLWLESKGEREGLWEAAWRREAASCWERRGCVYLCRHSFPHFPHYLEIQERGQIIDFQSLLSQLFAFSGYAGNLERCRPSWKSTSMGFAQHCLLCWEAGESSAVWRKAKPRGTPCSTSLAPRLLGADLPSLLGFFVFFKKNN